MIIRADDSRHAPWVYYIFRFILWSGLKIKTRLKVYNASVVPSSGGVIIASNHASFLDPPIIGVSIKNRIVRFMARDTLFKYRALGWLLFKFGVVPLARDKGDATALKTAIRLLRSGQCVSLFPEGTRTVTGRLQEAKGGIGFLIHKSEVPVVPVFIRGTFEAWPKGAEKMRSHPVSVHFGPPISPQELMISDERGKPDFDAIAKLVMSRIAMADPDYRQSQSM